MWGIKCSGYPPRKQPVYDTRQNFFRTRMPGGGSVWDPFLKQQFGRLNERLGVKTPLHNVAVDQIIERNQDHSLVMRHKGTDNDAFLTRRQAFRRKIDRFVKTETRQSSFLCQAAKIFHRGIGRNESSKSCGIRSTNQVFT